MLRYFGSAIALVSAAQSVGAGHDGLVWKWQSEPATCALRQQIDEAGSFIQITRTPGSDLTAIGWQDAGTKARYWKNFSGAKVTLEPGDSSVVGGSVGPGELPRSRIVWVSVDDQNILDRLSRASALLIAHEETGSVRIALHAPDAAVAALRKCEDAGMQKWGIDPAAWRALQSRPLPLTPPVTWFTTGDYPHLAAQFGVGGHVVTRLDVGPDGAVQDCTVVNRQVIANFKYATCSVLKRKGKFKPAVDASGQPTSAPFVIKVRFAPTSR